MRTFSSRSPSPNFRENRKKVFSTVFKKKKKKGYIERITTAPSLRSKGGYKHLSGSLYSQVHITESQCTEHNAGSSGLEPQHKDRWWHCSCVCERPHCVPQHKRVYGPRSSTHNNNNTWKESEYENKCIFKGMYFS